MPNLGIQIERAPRRRTHPKGWTMSTTRIVRMTKPIRPPPRTVLGAGWASTSALDDVGGCPPPPAANMNSGGGLALAEAVTYLADLARSVAADRGHVCIVEFAGSSESTYVHVRRPSVETTFETPPRPRHETWFGIRISAHPAKYACSGDYEQVLLSRSPGVDEVHRAAGVLIEAMRHGGRPVAEPHRVRGELWAAQVAAAIGQMATMIRGEREIVWTWQGIDRRWQTEADDPGPPPTTIPRVQLDTATTAAIRHRVNRREAWAATERRCDG